MQLAQQLTRLQAEAEQQQREWDALCQQQADQVQALRKDKELAEAAASNLQVLTWSPNVLATQSCDAVVTCMPALMPQPYVHCMHYTCQ